MRESNEFLFTPKDWTTIRWAFRIYGACLSLIAIAVLLSGKSLVGVFLSGLLLLWLVSLGLGFCFLVRLRQAKCPWYWAFVLNGLLLFVSYVASALALPVFAATFKVIGSRPPAFGLFLIDLSGFMKAWWWVLLTIGYAILALFTEALSKRSGPPAATRGLRRLITGQIIYLLVLGVATVLLTKLK